MQITVIYLKLLITNIILACDIYNVYCSRFYFGWSILLATLYFCIQKLSVFFTSAQKKSAGLLCSSGTYGE